LAELEYAVGSVGGEVDGFAGDATQLLGGEILNGHVRRIETIEQKIRVGFEAGGVGVEQRAVKGEEEIDAHGLLGTEAAGALAHQIEGGGLADGAEAGDGVFAVGVGIGA